MRDGYAGYDHITTATHAECGAHMLRGAQWMAQAAAAGHRSLDDEQVRFIRSAYAEALASGREANAKHPQAKASKLVRRFTRDADDAGLRADLVQ